MCAKYADGCMTNGNPLKKHEIETDGRRKRQPKLERFSLGMQEMVGVIHGTGAVYGKR
jgi:Tfp pilus assembly protein PilP